MSFSSAVQAGGYITAYPEGQPMPTASNVNFSARRITQNEAIVKVGADGYVDFTNTSAGSVDLIVDMSGYFTSGSGMAFVPIAPTRVLDTRLSQYAVGPVGANGTQPVSVGEQSSDGPWHTARRRREHHRDPTGRQRIHHGLSG